MKKANEKRINDFINDLPNIKRDEGEYFRAYCNGVISIYWQVGIMTQTRFRRVLKAINKIEEN